jgi:hypothetical protein
MLGLVVMIAISSPQLCGLCSSSRFRLGLPTVQITFSVLIVSPDPDLLADVRDVDNGVGRWSDGDV